MSGKWHLGGEVAATAHRPRVRRVLRLMIGGGELLQPRAAGPAVQGGKSAHFGTMTSSSANSPSTSIRPTTSRPHHRDDPAVREGRTLLHPPGVQRAALSAPRVARGYREISREVHNGLGGAAEAAPRQIEMGLLDPEVAAFAHRLQILRLVRCEPGLGRPAAWRLTPPWWIAWTGTSARSWKRSRNRHRGRHCHHVPRRQRRLHRGARRPRRHAAAGNCEHLHGRRPRVGLGAEHALPPLQELGE